MADIPELRCRILYWVADDSPKRVRMDQQRQLLAEFEQLARSGSGIEHLMQQICDRLHEQLARYNWVGFYLIDQANPDCLVLGPYSGTFTPHQRIALDKGLCGAAASTGKTLVVNDVTTDPRYLAGSEHTKSEIIVPIFAGSRLAGELDVNSYFKYTWNTQEQQFVESCAQLVGRQL
jgi:L-methionine (R)-S-oxide reductase